MILSVDFHAPS